VQPGEVRFEDLVGKVVHNEHGRPIARIDDVRVEPDGLDYVVTEYILGPVEWQHRLMAFVGELPTVRAMGMGRKPRLRPIPWHWIDLTDPERPQLVAAKKGGRDSSASTLE
jgi:sporulation protein YlmC with PRC-barrel domain